MIDHIKWQPTANIPTLKKRAEIIQKIRQFFICRDVLEVETPLLSWASGTDPQIMAIVAKVSIHPFQCMYLQTSPEFAMKRLLAAEAGAIFQICKAFRDEEYGRYHNPEFTMLEWYRTGYDLYHLMDEMDDLLRDILLSQPAKRYTYQALFEEKVGCNPHQVSAKELQTIASKYGIQEVSGIDPQDKTIWLQRLMSDVIEPALIGDRPYFVFDYPAEQAALAKVRQEDYPLASRFEVYYQGIELANGFHELTDATEQKARFRADLIAREKLGAPQVPIDDRLLAALTSGLPDCSGVALGIDRLIMLALDFNSIDAVIAFPFKYA